MTPTEIDKETVRLFNRVVASPENRIQLTANIAESLGFVLMIPTIMLEQLLTAAEDDKKILTKGIEKEDVVLASLAKIALEKWEQECIVLKSFLEIRAKLIETMIANGAKRCDMFPQ